MNDVETIIGELVTNAFSMANGGNYHIVIKFFGDEVTVIVIDNGIGFIIVDISERGTSRPDELSNDQEFRVGGFGLLLVRSLCDHVEWDENPMALTDFTHIIRYQYSLC